MAITVKISGNAGLLGSSGSPTAVAAAATGGTAPLTYAWTVSGTAAAAVTVTVDTADASKAIVAYKSDATLKAGTFTVKCTVTDSASVSGFGTLAMSLADPTPGRFTGAWANAYMAAMPADMQTRFADLCAIHEVSFPNTDVVLGSVQVGLLMEAI